MTMIFPNSCRDMDKHILSFCDTDSLVTLSGVNCSANQYLSNDLFEKHFQEQHPHLAQFPNVFSTLKECHPSSCWKIACSVLSKGFSPVKRSFSKEAIPVLINSLESQKAQLEVEYKAICGSFYADPNSPIDQAWKAYEQSAQEYNKKSDELQKYVYTEEDGGAVHNLIRAVREWREMVREQAKYEDLEAKRFEYVNSIELANQTIADLSSGTSSGLSDAVIEKHEAALRTEFDEAIHLEIASKRRPVLQECFNLICGLRYTKVEEPLVDLGRIRDLINSGSEEEQTFIWGSLYYKCANGVQEDQWSEKHFSEFLNELSDDIIRERVEEYWVCIRDHLRNAGQLMGLYS